MFYKGRFDKGIHAQRQKARQKHSCLRCFDKGVIVILGRRARSGAGAASCGGVGSEVRTGRGIMSRDCP
jgi:hypothetical protein